VKNVSQFGAVEVMTLDGERTFKVNGQRLKPYHGQRLKNVSQFVPIFLKKL